MDARKDLVMRVCLFEDADVLHLEPLTLTRPAFELRCGMTSLGDKQRRHFASAQTGVLIRPQLADLFRLQQPGLPVNDLAWLCAGSTILVNARWLPPTEPPAEMSSPCVGTIGEEVAFVVLGPEQLTGCSPSALADALETWKATLPHRSAQGTLIRYPWDLIVHNGEQIERDYRALSPRPSLPPGDNAPAVIGPRENLWIDPTARVEPMTLVDTTRGPVIVEREAVVMAFSRLEGPCVIGPGTHVLGAKIRAGTTLGSQCRIGGEVEASIVQGFSNKYHDGFLGHSYLGEWINLGAGTQNSDLRNDYGDVTVTIAGRRVVTGQTKVGCFLGDHTKSGLGSLLNTGTNAGVFCNLLPGGFLPKYMPSFCSWWNGVLTESADLSSLMKTAAVVMHRRGCEMTEAHAALYYRLFEQTMAERRPALREAELRRLRRTA